MTNATKDDLSSIDPHVGKHAGFYSIFQTCSGTPVLVFCTRSGSWEKSFVCVSKAQPAPPPPPLLPPVSCVSGHDLHVLTDKDTASEQTLQLAEQTEPVSPCPIPTDPTIPAPQCCCCISSRSLNLHMFCIFMYHYEANFYCMYVLIAACTTRCWTFFFSEEMMIQITVKKIRSRPVPKL